MDTQDAARIALGSWLLFFALAFGLRSLVQLRRTGSTGFIGISGRPGSAEWNGGVLFVVALIASVAAPLLQLRWDLPLPTVLTHDAARAVGILLCGSGVVGTLWAQMAMGDSWRIGVDTGARTELVGSGPFYWVRNPIFTAMLISCTGLALLVPNIVSLLAVVTLVIALQIQVRLVEEPYLIRAHGSPYGRYAAATGRFLPGVGRLSGETGQTPWASSHPSGV